MLALINSHAAAALQYGIERDFTNKSEWVVLYDMGAASTEAALVRFSSFTIKEYGKAKSYRWAAMLWNHPTTALVLVVTRSTHILTEVQFLRANRAMRGAGLACGKACDVLMLSCK